MRFRVSRKINLSNIDAKLWPYETEDIEVSDADSFEDAQKKVEQYYNERIGYYKAIAQSRNQPQPILQPATSTTGGGTIATPPVGNTTPTPTPATFPPAPAQPVGYSNNPPAEFNV